jgi:hypothetical protein
MLEAGGEEAVSMGEPSALRRLGALALWCRQPWVMPTRIIRMTLLIQRPLSNAIMTRRWVRRVAAPQSGLLTELASIG